MNCIEKKNKQLGMPLGTASARLRKKILFSLIKECGKNVCYQCGKPIETEEELSIEHKIPWLDSNNPKELFFSIDNIAFSHLRCNCAARRETDICRKIKVDRARNGKLNKVLDKEVVYNIRELLNTRSRKEVAEITKQSKGVIARIAKNETYNYI